jgi:hypothetical protein
MDGTYNGLEHGPGHLESCRRMDAHPCLASHADHSKRHGSFVFHPGIPGGKPHAMLPLAAMSFDRMPDCSYYIVLKIALRMRNGEVADS